MTQSKDIRSSTQEMYWRRLTDLTNTHINSGKPPPIDLRASVLKKGLEQRIGNIREKTPELISEHFLGVSTVTNPKALKYQIDPTYIYGLHHRGYPSAFKYNLEGKLGPTHVATLKAPLSPSKITQSFWGRTQALGGITNWLISRHNGDSSLVRTQNGQLWDSWNSILGYHSTNMNTTHLGGGKTLKGIQASMFKALLNEKVRGNSEYGYLYFLFTAAFGGLLNMDVDERLKVRWEVLTRAGVDPHPHSQRCFVAPNWGTVKPYWEGRYNPFLTLDKVRNSLYTTLSKYGFERSGSKPGEFIWMHTDAPYHENPAYLAENVDFIRDYPTRSDIDNMIINGKVPTRIHSGFSDTAMKNRVIVLNYLNEKMPEYLEQQFLNMRS